MVKYIVVRVLFVFYKNILHFFGCMVTQINEAVSVKLVYNHVKQSVKPEAFYWRGRAYKVDKVGLHHFFKKGSTLSHIFSVVCGETAFRLALDTETLHWKVEEVSDV